MRCKRCLLRAYGYQRINTYNDIRRCQTLTSDIHFAGVASIRLHFEMQMLIQIKHNFAGFSIEIFTLTCILPSIELITVNNRFAWAFVCALSIAYNNRFDETKLNYVGDAFTSNSCDAIEIDKLSARKCHFTSLATIQSHSGFEANVSKYFGSKSKASWNIWSSY